MTTLEPEQRDILDKLNEIALDAHWETVERVNEIPKAVAVIMEAIEEIKRLRELPKKIFDRIDEESKTFSGRGTIDYIGGYKHAIREYARRFDKVRKQYGVTLD